MGLNAQQCVYLVLAFATGFAVNRYMNHQDIITGDVKEGFDNFWGWLLGGIGIFVVGIVVFKEPIRSRRGVQPAMFSTSLLPK